MLALAGFAATAIGVGAFFYRTATGRSWRQSLFQSYLWLNGLPGCSLFNETGWGRGVVNGLYITGILTFASLLGLLSTALSTAIASFRYGNFPVHESGHTVVLNWNDRTTAVLRQLDLAKKEGRDPGTVVVLSDQSRPTMDMKIAEDVKRQSTLRIVTREGDPNSLTDLDKAAAGAAKNVLVLRDTAAAKGAEQTGGASAVRRQTAVLAAVRDRQSNDLPSSRAAKHPPTVVVSVPEAAVEQHPGASAAGRFASLAEVDTDGFVDRLLAQCVVQPGLSTVYAELFHQEGSEFYIEAARMYAGVQGKTFGQAWKHFPRASLCGLVKDGELMLSPPNSVMIGPNDQLIFVATDKTNLRYSRSAVGTHEVSDVRRSRRATQAEMQKAYPRKVLILNTAKADLTMDAGSSEQTASLLRHLDEWAATFTKPLDVTLVTPAPLNQRVGQLHVKAFPRPTTCRRFGNLRIRTVVKDPSTLKTLKSVKAEDADVALLVHLDGSSVRSTSDVNIQQERDAEILGMRLLLESHMRDTNKPMPRVVTHLSQALSVQYLPAKAAPRPWRLPYQSRRLASSPTLMLRATRAKLQGVDVIVPAELESGVLVQILMQPELQHIYTELLQPSGKEICVPVINSKYKVAPKQTITVAQLNELARAEGDSVIGVWRDGEPLQLNPPKASKTPLKPTDRCVLISDAF